MISSKLGYGSYPTDLAMVKLRISTQRLMMFSKRSWKTGKPSEETSYVKLL